jgi:hypothetical protein
MRTDRNDSSNRLWDQGERRRRASPRERVLGQNEFLLQYPIFVEAIIHILQVLARFGRG